MSGVRLCGALLVGAAVLFSGCAKKDPVLPGRSGGEDLVGADVEGAALAELQNEFGAVLTGEELGVDTRARGRVSFEFNEALTEVSYRLLVSNVEEVTVVDLVYGLPHGEVITALYPVGESLPADARNRSLGVEGTITAADLEGSQIESLGDLRAVMTGGYCTVVVRTEAYPAGEISGHVLPPRSADSPNPRVNLYDRHVGAFLSSSEWEEPGATLETPAGLPLRFVLSASAATYGEKITAYRYYWRNEGEPEGWRHYDGSAIDLEIPLPHGASSGVYELTVAVRDTRNHVSHVRLAWNIVPLPMRRPLLVVDDWRENSPGFAPTNGGVPSDEEHDAFWNEIASAVAGFDPVTDVVEANGSMTLSSLADYKSVVWVGQAAYNSTTASYVNGVIRFRDPRVPLPPGAIVQNFVAMYMEAGGHVFLCGEEIMAASINRVAFQPISPVFPLIFRYELTADQDGDYEESEVGVRGVGDPSFAYEDCGLNVLDIAYISNRLSIRRSGVHSCPVSAIRPAPQSGYTHGLRTAIPAAAAYEFPAMTLRPECAAPGKWYAEDRTGLNCDIYNPAFFESVCAAYTEYGTLPYFEPIYGNGCLSASSPIYNAPVAFWTSKYADRMPAMGGGPAARSAVWGFSPVFFNPAQVKEALEIVFFDEWMLPREAAVSHGGARELSR